MFCVYKLTLRRSRDVPLVRVVLGLEQDLPLHNWGDTRVIPNNILQEARLNTSQLDVLHTALNAKLCIVQGPPGRVTGCIALCEYLLWLYRIVI